MKNISDKLALLASELRKNASDKSAIHALCDAISEIAEPLGYKLHIIPGKYYTPVCINTSAAKVITAAGGVRKGWRVARD